MAQATPKKKPISAKQASAVASLLKGQKAGMGSVDNGPALPTPKQNPITTANDDEM